jgi:hypothetical protein
MASVAIANRFKQVLGGIISDTQKGFMKDRFKKFDICPLFITQLLEST